MPVSPRATHDFRPLTNPPGSQFTRARRRGVSYSAFAETSPALLTRPLLIFILLSVNTQKSFKQRKGGGSVRLSIVVDEATWRGLRDAAEAQRSTRGRASVNALINRLIAEYLAKRKAKGGP